MSALLCFVLAVLVVPFKSKAQLEAENAALRHKLIVRRFTPILIKSVNRSCSAVAPPPNKRSFIFDGRANKPDRANQSTSNTDLTSPRHAWHTERLIHR
jgi:hypothetical protein